MKKSLHYVLLLNLFLYGCGAINYHLESVQRSIDIIAQVRQEYEQNYIGKSKEVLLQDFGKPYVKYNILKDGILYDEEWFYRTSGSWLQTDSGGAVWFYIKDGKIAAISVS